VGRKTRSLALERTHVLSASVTLFPARKSAFPHLAWSKWPDEGAVAVWQMFRVQRGNRYYNRVTSSEPIIGASAQFVASGLRTAELMDIGL